MCKKTKCFAKEISNLHRGASTLKLLSFYFDNGNNNSQCYVHCNVIHLLNIINSILDVLCDKSAFPFYIGHTRNRIYFKLIRLKEILTELEKKIRCEHNELTESEINYYARLLENVKDICDIRFPTYLEKKEELVIPLIKARSCLKKINFKEIDRITKKLM